MIFKRADNRKMTGLVDVHCHVLPGLDDGSHDISETMEMLHIAVDEGITDMMVTPHFNSGGRSAPPEVVLQTLQNVQAVVQQEGLPIRLFPGNEVYYFSDLPRYLQEHRVLTMNGSKHVLIEFSPSVMFRTLQNAMEDVLGVGYTPILAHVERYNCMLEDSEYVDFLRDMGVQIQVNASSIVGKSGTSVKKFVFELLQDGLVNYVGTDSHGCEHRTPQIAKCRNILSKKFSPSYVDRILRDNAMQAFGLNNNDRRE